MEYFKEVHIPSWGIIQQFCRNSWDGKFITSKNFYGKDLAYLGSLLEPDVKSQLGHDVKIKTAVMFINRPQFKQDMHIDGYTIDRANTSNTALNLPILNCDTGPMFWYDGEYTLSMNTSVTIKYLKITWQSGPTLAAEALINKPTIVRVNIPHHIENRSDNPRLMLSVRFTPDIQLG
ncbi:hypothetical protein UFOVP71_438 [uncultured Caudovirales phage]|uniref:Uncharacterized protein n=1 Tax=uncultured Caudovirales phage TaxID=2100421 RepID=A0A6J5TE07_9CAUD|nr:hypothetical protein UFOVP71_438 [uncultured Caudovirales phage]